jgi:hypothetical protein
VPIPRAPPIRAQNPPAVLASYTFELRNQSPCRSSKSDVKDADFDHLFWSYAAMRRDLLQRKRYRRIDFRRSSSPRNASQSSHLSHISWNSANDVSVKMRLPALRFSTRRLKE